jgi:hypothetical protein
MPFGASASEDWRFVGAAGKVAFELLHLNLARAQPDFPAAHPRVKLCGAWPSVIALL